MNGLVCRVFVYRYDAGTGVLLPAAVPEQALPPGTGPRHLAVTRPPDRPDATAGDQTEEPSRELRPCPCCGGRMLVIETFERGRAPRSRLPSAFTVDTS